MSITEIWLDSATAFKSASVPDLQHSELVGSADIQITDTPSFSFQPGFNNVIGVKVIEAVIPTSWNTWDSYLDPYTKSLRTNLKITHTPSNTSANLFIAPNSYTGASLAAAMTTAFNGSTFTNFLTGLGASIAAPSIVTFDSHQRFQWEMTIAGLTVGVDGFKFAAGPLTDSNVGRSLQATILGLSNSDNVFNSQSSGLNIKYTLYSPLYASPNGWNYVTVCSRVLGPLFKVLPNDSTLQPNYYQYDSRGISNQLEMIPLTTNFGEITTWQESLPEVYETGISPVKIDNFDLYITWGPQNYPIRFQGQSFQVKIRFTMADNFSSNKRRLEA